MTATSAPSHPAATLTHAAGTELPAATRRPSRLTVACCGVVIASADEFWVTSLRGAVGAIDASRHPIEIWLRDAALMTPLMTIALMASFVATRRMVARPGRGGFDVVVAGLLVVLSTTAIALGHVTVNALNDYAVQVEQLEHAHTGLPIEREPVILFDRPVAESQVLAAEEGCDASCVGRRATRDAHVKSIGLAGMVLVVTNAVLVAWTLALRGGRLWTTAAPPRRFEPGSV